METKRRAYDDRISNKGFISIIILFMLIIGGCMYLGEKVAEYLIFGSVAP